MSISKSVRTLYRTIGDIIGKQVFDRIASDINLSTELNERRAIARETIDTMMALRKEMNTSRDFTKIQEIITKLFDKDHKIAIKQFSWILEAYLLLNQSSTASAEVTKDVSSLPDRVHASRLIKRLKAKSLSIDDLIKFFTEDFSANLVLTAHPTAGIQPDYIRHINDMLASVQRLADLGVVSDLCLSKEDDSEIPDIKEDLKLSVSHMVRAKPYNENSLEPIDESNNFLMNVNKAWDLIPKKIIALENELKRQVQEQDPDYDLSNFEFSPDFFKVHSWVARDVDGNPTVSSEQHLSAALQERIHFLSLYREELDKLWRLLSDDFTNDPALPNKTFFVDENFEKLYNTIIENNPEIANQHQAYRVVIEYAAIIPLDIELNNLIQLEDNPILDYLKQDSYSLQDSYINVLRLIKSNKEGINTKEIDLALRKAYIFGEYGSRGHTRQGNDHIANLMQLVTGFEDYNKIPEKTAFTLDPDFKALDIESLRAVIINNASLDPKSLHRVVQSFDLLKLSASGSIHRQIISMNSCYEDMLNVLSLLRCFSIFTPAANGKLPESRMEIVPLTEQISDLRSSYEVSIEALSNTAWHEYLIANGGRFIKMRGPSDSGKQNGFLASQWEMFKSKLLDSLVVEIFNAYLDDFAWGKANKLKRIRTFAKEINETELIYPTLQAAITAFDKAFAEGHIPIDLWKQAKEELGLDKVTAVNFDGWGEPVERGGGLEFEDTVKYTQPFASSASYERTLQGGGAQQLGSGVRTKQAMQDFMNGLADLASKRILFEKDYLSDDEDISIKALQESYTLDADWANMMDKIVHQLRSSLRTEVFGIDLDNDTKVINEDTLRDYFRHVLKSPLLYLDLFNIASRPTSRSGTKIKEMLGKYSNSIDKFADVIDQQAIIKILGDVRAIPYAAMFSLLGGNHVSFYGYDKLLADKDLMQMIQTSYSSKLDNQESRLTRHMINSLERGIMTADLNCYTQAHEIIEKSTKVNYSRSEDPLLAKLIAAEQHTRNFIAAVKGYDVANPNAVTINELMQDDTITRDLLIARRNDAAIPRIGIAVAMSAILKDTQKSGVNPLDAENISIPLLDLLRKAFAAGASTFGNGCID